MKKEIKNLKLNQVYRRFCSIYKTMLSYCFKCRKGTESKNPKAASTKRQKNNDFIKMFSV